MAEKEKAQLRRKYLGWHLVVIGLYNVILLSLVRGNLKQNRKGSLARKAMPSLYGILIGGYLSTKREASDLDPQLPYNQSSSGYSERLGQSQRHMAGSAGY